MLKNKPDLVTINESILVSRWTFQSTLVNKEGTYSSSKKRGEMAGDRNLFSVINSLTDYTDYSHQNLFIVWGLRTEFSSKIFFVTNYKILRCKFSLFYCVFWVINENILCLWQGFSFICSYANTREILGQALLFSWGGTFYRFCFVSFFWVFFLFIGVYIERQFLFCHLEIIVTCRIRGNSTERK